MPLGLDSIVDEIARSRTCIIMNPGNAGDALIALGTFHWLDRLGLHPTILSFANLDYAKDFDLIVYGGGGNLVPMYGTALTAIDYAARLGKQVAVLPHTIFGCEDALLRHALNLRLFCRERQSYEGLLAAGFPDDRLALDHDMAFQIEERFFSSLQPIAPSRDTISCLRRDAESAQQIPSPVDNLDISLLWNGDYWSDREFVESICRCLAAYLMQAKSITTDRLHISILGALLKLEVRMLPNSYYKNRAVYDFSLDRFRNVTLVGQERNPGMPQTASVNLSQ
jgi:exopolysaccharide biosynthesis predicted pyruvyltransferase EpsI